MMNAIEIRALSKTYRGKRGARVEALVKLNLDVLSGEVFGFLGPNGAGKSTAIKLLTGQLRLSGGHAELFGVPVSDPVARSRLGYLPENPSLHGHMNAMEHLRFVGQIHGLDTQRIVRDSQRILELLELDKDAKRPVKGYSKGMTQRLALAVALLPDPDLLILDEPMSGLDPLGRALVKDIILDSKQRGKTVFFSTHITSDIEAVCDRIGIVVRGHLRALENVDELLREGVEGYQVRYVDKTGNELQEMIARDHLREQLDTLLATGVTLNGIEPHRRDMEAYFLQTVRDAEA